VCEVEIEGIGVLRDSVEDKEDLPAARKRPINTNRPS
jgi:hypothetical protein